MNQKKSKLVWKKNAVFQFGKPQKSCVNSVFDSHQVVKIAEDVNAEESRADGEDVKVKLMVWQHAGVPKILFSKFLD